MAGQYFNREYEITEDHLQEICNLLPNGPHIGQIVPMNTGLSAYTTKIEFISPDTPPAVLRVINPENEAIFEKELGAILYARRHHIPAPKVIHIDSGRQILNEPYYIYEYVTGDILGWQISELIPSQQESLYRHLGQLLATMHLDQRPAPGEMLYHDGALRFQPYSWDCPLGEFYLRGQAQDFQWALDHGFRERYPQLYRGCKAIWAKYKDALLEGASPIGFAHNDLLADNVIIENGEVQAIIDWEQGDYSGVLYDLARSERGLLRRMVFLAGPAREKLREAFLEAYAAIRSIEPEYYQQRIAHHIVQAMDDLGQMDAFTQRFSLEICQKIEENLVSEIEEYIQEYT